MLIKFFILLIMLNIIIISPLNKHVFKLDLAIIRAPSLKRGASIVYYYLITNKVSQFND